MPADKLDTILIARLCSQSSYDTPKITRYINQRTGGHLEVRDFNEEMIRISQDRANSLPVFSFRVHNQTWLDSLEQRYARVAFNIYINDIEAFNTLLRLFKARFRNPKVIFIIDNPFNFFNDYCSFANNARQLEGYQKSFFERELYRIDKVLAQTEKIVSQSEIFIAASNSHLENEKSVIQFLDIPWNVELEKLSLPNTIVAKRANRLFGTNPLQENITLEEWRNILHKWEKPNVKERLIGDEGIHHLNALIDKYWRFARKRYPVLENVLDISEKDMLQLPWTAVPEVEWRDITDAIPEEKQSQILKTNPVLRRTLPPYQQKFFEVLEADRKDSKACAIPKCCVLTFAYNQEKYIGECIESVASQELDCELEHIIIDDASTDATPDIIRDLASKYPHIRPVFFKTKPANLIATAFNACKSQYLALCDGDDYFTDKYKLQKQIDFLDANPDCSICFHKTEVFYEDGRPSHIYPPDGMLRADRHCVYSLEDLLQGNPMQTSSVMYRWRFAQGLPAWFKGFLVPGDWYWHLLHAEKGKIGFIPELMSRYRRHPNAGYATADEDTVKHRLKKGMLELETYQIGDEHFKGARHRDFQILADGVFASYLKHYAQSDDSSFLDKAIESFPVLTKGFLADLENAGKRQ